MIFNHDIFSRNNSAPTPIILLGNLVTRLTIRYIVATVQTNQTCTLAGKYTKVVQSVQFIKFTKNLLFSVQKIQNTKFCFHFSLDKIHHKFFTCFFFSFFNQKSNTKLPRTPLLGSPTKELNQRSDLSLSTETHKPITLLVNLSATYPTK